MSGGTWDYNNYILGEIAEDIKTKIERNNKPIPWEKLESWDKQDYDNNKKKYLKDPMYYSQYDQSTLDIFKKAYKALCVADIYAHHIDYFIAGDIGNDLLKERIKKDIKQIEKV